MSLNILLVEQDEDFHEAIVEFLHKRRYAVTACRSYDEAASKLARIPDRSRAPDAVVSDADGLGFYMKARQRFPGMRWIVTASRHQPALPGNPMLMPVEVPVEASADFALSSRLTDQFLPSRGAIASKS